jgi:hypothetical protein
MGEDICKSHVFKGLCPEYIKNPQPALISEQAAQLRNMDKWFKQTLRQRSYTEGKGAHARLNAISHSGNVS